MSKPDLTVVPEPDPAQQALTARAQDRLDKRAMLEKIWDGMTDDPRFERLSWLIFSNMDTGQECAEKGAALDDASLINNRIEWILNEVLPPGSSERLDFEIRWQEMLEGSLSNMVKRLKQVQFEENFKTAPKSLIIPKPNL